MMRGIRILRDFIRGRRGNVALIFAVAAVPITLLTGMGVDYTTALDRQVQLNAAADAGVLAAITPTMMTQPATVAAQAAKDTFNAQAAAITGVTYAASDVSVTVAATGAKRVVTLNYKASSQNLFAAVVNMNSMPLSGGAQGTGGQAPNIDFYLLLDASPSMLIGATQTDINKLMAKTTHQDSPNGCAFACHQTNTANDNLGNAGGADNYSVARKLGLTLRIDLLKQAAQNLMDTAAAAKTTNNTAYRAAIYTFDQGFNTISTLTSDLNSTAATSAKTLATGVDVETVYQNNWLTKTNYNNDTDTDYANAMTSINTAMPDPGSGTAVNGDKPQEVLFFVTDGVNDAMVNGSRVHSVMDPAKCAAIKARGIRIAVLYTEYLPLPYDAWYNGHVASFQSNIAPSLQACASPGLFSTVTTGGDISAALATLFQYAVQSAYLSQ